MKKVKVLMYAADGNTLVMPYKELTPIEGAEGVFYYPEFDKYNGELWHIVFDIQGVLVEEGSYRKETILKPENFSVLVPAKNDFINRWRVYWVQSLYIKLYELLGLDTAPLHERRAKLIAKKEAEKKEAEQERIKKAKDAAIMEAERLDGLFEKFKSGDMVNITDFVNLIRHKGVELHPRTIGMLNKLNQTSEISPTRARLGKGGKKVPQSTFNSAFEAAAKLAAA